MILLNLYFKKLNVNFNGNVPNSAKLSTFLDKTKYIGNTYIGTYINIFQTIELFKYYTLKATTTLHVSILAK